MHFVDNIYLETAPRRRIGSVFKQLPHFIDFGICRSIHFKQIDETTTVNLGAGRAHTTGGSGNSTLTIQRLSQNPGDCRLTDTARPCKEISMMQALLGEGMCQRSDYMLLPYECGKIARPPLAGKNLITHTPHINAEMKVASLTPGTCRK